mgnify:CR=1 FL=1
MRQTTPVVVLWALVEYFAGEHHGLFFESPFADFIARRGQFVPALATGGYFEGEPNRLPNRAPVVPCVFERFDR